MATEVFNSLFIQDEFQQLKQPWTNFCFRTTGTQNVQVLPQV